MQVVVVDHHLVWRYLSDIGDLSGYQHLLFAAATTHKKTEQKQQSPDL